MALLAALPPASGWCAPDWQIGRGKWSGMLGMSYNQSNFSGENAISTVTGSTHNLQETLSILGNGLYVLDPRLVRFNLGLDLAHNQSAYGSESAGSSTEGGSTDIVLGYNLDADIFSNKPYPARLYANRIQSQTSQNFGGLTVGTSQALGFSLQLKDESFLKDWGGPWLNASLSASQQHSQSTSSYFDRVFRTDRTAQSFAFSANKGFSTADLRFRYRASQYDNALREEPSNLAQSASLNYSVDFGPGLNRYFASSLSYATARGLEPTNTFRATEILHINHLRNLSTDTSYNVTREDNEGIISLMQDGSFAVSHTLYKNLSTSAFLNVSQNSLPAGTTAFYSGQLSQNYQHSLPGGGSLGLNWSGSYQRSSNALSSGEIPVGREPHLAEPTNALEPGFLLNNPFVIETSIEVFNFKDGTREPVPKSAYSLQKEGNFVRITPFYLDLGDPNAPIKPGDDLQVDYIYQVDARLENETRNLGYGINVGYGWIAGSYQHQQTEQNPLTGESRFLSSSTSDSVNLSVRGRWLGLPMAVGTSHSRNISRGVAGTVQEDLSRLSFETSGRLFDMDARGNASMGRYRGARSGYDNRQISGTLIWRPEFKSWNMSFGANASNIQHRRPARQTTTLSARGSFTWDSPGGWVNSAYVGLNNTSNSDSEGGAGQSSTMQLGGNTSFRLGKLTLTSGVSFDFMTGGDSKAKSQTFYLSLTRAFR